MYCISDFCHLCLKDDKSLIDLSIESPENEVTKSKLNVCISEVEWAASKQLLICTLCLEKLESAYNFKQTCIKSCDMFRKRVTLLKPKARRAKLHIPLAKESIAPDITQKYILERNNQIPDKPSMIYAPATGLIITSGQQTSYQNIFLNFVSTDNLVYPFMTNQPVLMNVSNQNNDSDTILKQLLETKDREEVSVDIDPTLYDFEHFLTSSTPVQTPNIECTMCELSYATIKLLRVHFDEVHGGILPFTCTFCFSKFLLQDHFDKHMQNHMENIHHTVNLDNLSKVPQQGLLGNIQNDSFETLAEHLQDSHNKKPIKTYYVKGAKTAWCEVCDRDFSTFSYLKQHMKIHDQGRVHRNKKSVKKNKEYDTIDLSNDSNGVKENIDMQLVNCSESKVTKTSQNKCFGNDTNNIADSGIKNNGIEMNEDVIEISDENFNETADVTPLKEFIDKGADGKLFCALCKKTFARRQDLHKHIKVLHLKCQFQCHLCGEEFSEGSQLTEHLHCHYSSIRCCECRQIFTSLSEITNHMIATHSELKRIECNVCNCMTFTDASQIKAHMDAHLLEIVYKCHLCGKIFGECAALAQHVLEHGGLRSCDTCNRIFQKEEDFVRHKHSCGLGNFKCDVCPKAFKTKRYLQNHIKSKHAIEMSVDEPRPRKKLKSNEDI